MSAIDWNSVARVVDEYHRERMRQLFVEAFRPARFLSLIPIRDMTTASEPAREGTPPRAPGQLLTDA